MKTKFWLKFAVNAVRFFVALIFVFSGFVKLVDPIGSAYKMQEYFSEEVLNIPFLQPYALVLIIGLIGFELFLGVTLFIGYFRQRTLWSLFAITLWFLFLTWYSAYYDKVTDCGCFGDAVQLTAWETFYKNVVLLVLILFMLLTQKSIIPLMSKEKGLWVALVSILAILSTAYYVLIHLPIIDFRPFAVGKSIQEGMAYPEDSEDLPPIHDFFLESDTEDLTDKILAMEQVLLIVAYDLEKVQEEALPQIKKAANHAQRAGLKVFGLSASSSKLMKDVVKSNNLPFDFLFCDETTLKTMIRSNPGLMTLSKGTVTGKWSWHDAEVFIKKH